jgi:hypothetical protein
MSRPRVEEIAALTARLRTVAALRADDAERARFLADKRALLDRIEGPRTALDAARELAAEGRTQAEAEALVSRYLDDMSERVGVSVHQWGLDAADLDEIRAGEQSATLAAVDDAHVAVAALPDPPAVPPYTAEDGREDGMEAVR